MIIQLTKNTGKPHVIKYIRDNGTDTWMHCDDFFIRHDLSHYAIEKTLGYTNAFYGMLNRGMNVKDFEDREKRKKLTLSAEAVYAENMANLFLLEMAQGQLDNFNVIQQSTLNNLQLMHIPGITLEEEKIKEIRTSLKHLLIHWQELPPGNTWELQISV